MRRKLTVATVFIVVTTTVTIGSFLIPPTYTVQTTIMIKHGREFFYRAAVGDVTNSPLISLREMVNSEVEILNSRSLAGQVIREMGLERVYPDMLEDPEREPRVP